MNAPLPLQAIRPVWLFSLDSEGFHAAPTTTGALIAWYRARGARAASVAFRQLHFRDRAEVESRSEQLIAEFAAHCARAPDAAFPPVAGLSFYTWNAAEFLALAGRIRACCPQAVIVAGGPHVQQAEDWLAEDPIDVVVLGEGELTFQELLDTPRTRWSEVPGLAWRDARGMLRRNRTRARQLRLEELPSPFDAIELCDAEGRPLYDAVSYETSRGCPFKCAFCEWGTGAIGTKMVSFPMERLRRDWERIVRAGIPNIWLADSNFGALRDDLEKARLICELKERYGLPRTFATSWSKKHSPRVQEIVLLLNRHGLLPFYQLALQTLTPRALELCHRENMAANEYEPIARRMAAAGVPISAELIWGLPGDDLQSFETNLGRLLATFPDINIFGYTLLPGTEFYQRRAEYRIETIPVAGYGKAKGEYVVGSLSFPRAEGEEGYFLITAHQLLVSGQVLACTVRFLALQARAAVGGLLREVTDGLLEEFADAIPGLDRRARLEVYEARAAIYLRVLTEPARVYSVIRERVTDWLARHAMRDLCQPVDRLIDLDSWLCPRTAEESMFTVRADFDAKRVLEHLDAMTLPPPQAFAQAEGVLRFRSPGGLGVVLMSPDGGRWLRSRVAGPEDSPGPPLKVPPEAAEPGALVLQ